MAKMPKYMGDQDWTRQDRPNDAQDEGDGNWSYRLPSGYRHTFKAMGCINPKIAFLSGQKSKISSNVTIPRPCGDCFACLRRKQSTRAMQIHAQMKTQQALNKPSTFITLTYRDSYLGNALDYEPVQTMIRALRQSGLQFKHYTKPELGDKTLRPHWHAILFGSTLTGQPLSANPKGDQDYHFPLWKYGMVHQKPMHHDMASYLSKYATKLTAKDAGYDPALFKSRQSMYLGRDYLNLWVENCARISLEALPDLIQIDGRNYPISSYVKKQLNTYFEQLGGKPFVPPSMDKLHADGILLAEAIREGKLYPMLAASRGIDEKLIEQQANHDPASAKRAKHLGTPKARKTKTYRKPSNERF